MFLSIFRLNSKRPRCINCLIRENEIVARSFFYKNWVKTDFLEKLAILELTYISSFLI